MHQTQLKYYPKYPQSFTGKTCSPLLCYRFVSTTLAAQIPSGNAIANSQGLLHAETGFSYFGARYYDSDILTGWLSVDPMADKYPGLSPYAYCAWNPVKLVDPDGEEEIVVSGSPGKHKNKLHFLVNGLDRAVKAKKQVKKGEVVTWLIYNDAKSGFNVEDLNKYVSKAKRKGIDVKVFSSVDEIVDYINNKNGGNSRDNDKISNFYYVGHATPGDLDVGYAGTGEDFDPSDLSPDAFSSGANIDVVGGCNTAVDWIFGSLDPSIVKQFAKILDKESVIKGSNVRVQYDGGIRSNKQLLKENNGKEIVINGCR